jgi:DNA helicase-2/ATP-dependent DNA helicase PcrA
VTDHAPHSDANADPILAGLTAPQRQAVQHTDGPLLILAAAGSGKTRVITRRIARMVRDGIAPWSILAVTFTNKAAGEMRERVNTQILGPGSTPELARADRRTRGLTITTFHSLCARLLRKYADIAELPGLKPDYAIFDSSDQMATMKRVLTGMGLKTTNWPPRAVLTAISDAKNKLMDADAFAAQANDYYSNNIAKIYTSYQAKLRQNGALDFDDLLLMTAKLLRTRDDIRGECQARWRYLMIDEYQDTNAAQLELAHLLAGNPPSQPAEAFDDPFADAPERANQPTAESTAAAGCGPNICVVGDPDQAIYGWRGADISNILEFEEHYPSAKVIQLGENFRSTAPILSVADTLIKHNKTRKDKPLYTTTVNDGGPVEVTLCRDERHEANLIADFFCARHEDGVPYKDMAVFYRTNALSRVLEDAMRTSAIPYVIARGTAFFDREEIKNAISYLRVIANPSDDVSLRRIINTPTRGIGKTTIDTLQQLGDRHAMPLFEAMRRCKETGLAPRATAALDRFVGIHDSLTGAGSFMGAQITGSLADLTERAIKESGLEAHYQKQADASGAETDQDRLDNLSELISAAREFENEYDPSADPFAFDLDAAEQDAAQQDPAQPGDAPDEPAAPPLLAMLRAYLESVSLVADSDKIDPAQGAVTLMTLHASKGLEFPAVGMIGLEEGTLPHSRAFESPSEMEEERRLAFVGITRAMRHLLVGSAQYRTIRGMTERMIPSRFLTEMNNEHVRLSDQTTSYGTDGLERDGIDQTERGYDESPMSKIGSKIGANLGSGTAGSRASISDQLERVRDQRHELTAGASAAARAEFPPGARVRHPQFGEGVVIAIKGGQHVRAEIEFKGLGRKTLVLEYARLRRV